MWVSSAITCPGHSSLESSRIIALFKVNFFFYRSSAFEHFDWAVNYREKPNVKTNATISDTEGYDHDSAMSVGLLRFM
jgi:hypothetical protein